MKIPRISRASLLPLILLSIGFRALAAPTVLKDSDGKIIAALAVDETESNLTWKQNRLAPKGSAALTPSGRLESQGIRYIIHAATASMGTFDSSTEPSIKSVQSSIRNSIRLAEKMGVRKLAIPFIGGGIFLSRLNVTPEELTLRIVEAARDAKSPVEIVFVAYTPADESTFRSVYKKSAEAPVPSGAIARLWASIRSYLSGGGEQNAFFTRSSVVQGSITEFSVHGAEAIVNAANMELQFGGGMSGVIAEATGESENIDHIAQDLLDVYYK